MMFRNSLVCLACLAAVATQADDYNPRLDGPGPSQSDFGGVGLLQMPTARMARVGEFSASYMDNEEYRRWSVSVQPYEWLEATVRYTDVRPLLYGPEDFSGDQSYKDKGMDVKLRLLQERRWLPQVAVGIRDFTGTGLFDSEFLVASKAWGPLDITLGMGWGNMAESGNIKNPFCQMSDAWCDRNEGYSGRGGRFEVDSLFHGPAALFGGVEYQTPWQPLRLKLEYDGNDYSNEKAGRILQASAWNVGAVYRLMDTVDTHISYQRGNTLMWGFTLRTNFNDIYQIHLDEPRAKRAAEHTQPDEASLRTALARNAGFKATAVYQEPDGKLTLVGEQTKYRDKQEAETRALTLLGNAYPEHQAGFKVVYTKQGMPVEQAEISNTLWQQQQDPVLGQPKPTNPQRKSGQPPAGTALLAAQAERWSYGWKPQLQQSFGGPEDFYLYQFGLDLSADLKLAGPLSLGGTLYWNWFDNLDKFTYTTPPGDTDALPRVRTWIREYVSSSDLLLNNFQLTAMDRLAEDWYGQVYGGYLEMMYAGVGSELLYRPYGKAWALGTDINYVLQRDWNNTLKLADYSVATGHVTGYWQLPFLDDTQAKISVGRYLAKDVGTTLDLSKRFDSGIVAGAFATFTNVSAEEYGEGSFTKGIYFTIPLDLLLVHPTTRTGALSWVPLTRDGGQKLGRRYGLYSLTEPLH